MREAFYTFQWVENGTPTVFPELFDSPEDVAFFASLLIETGEVGSKVWLVILPVRSAYLA